MKYTCKGEVFFRPAPRVEVGNFPVIKPGEVIEGEVDPATGWIKHIVGGKPYFSHPDYFTTVKPAPVPSPTKPLLGVHIKGAHHLGVPLAADGCPMVLVMGGHTFAHQLAIGNPKMKVIYRAYIGSARLSADQMLTAMEVNKDDPGNLLYVGYNESDSIGTSIGELETRSHMDIELAHKIKEKGSRATYLAGSFGHGNPPLLETQAVQDAMRKFYAPSYNAGLFGFDMHNYTRGKRRLAHPPERGQHADWIVDPIWFERRWEFFFTKCGFDPTVRACYSTETGVEAGAGGFQWAGYSVQEFKEWCSDYQAIQSKPLVVDGQSYPSPFVGSVIFQAGDHNFNNGGWGGYDIEALLPALKEFY